MFKAISPVVVALGLIVVLVSSAIALGYIFQPRYTPKYTISMKIVDTEKEFTTTDIGDVVILKADVYITCAGEGCPEMTITSCQVIARGDDCEYPASLQPINQQLELGSMKISIIDAKQLTTCDPTSITIVCNVIDPKGRGVEISDAHSI